jgi:diamine N-acetyltransferase
MFNISEASQKDIPSIIGIAEKTWWPTYSPILSADQIRYMLDTIYAPEHIEDQISRKIQTYLLLSENEKPQAFASFGERPGEPGVYKLYKLYVLPANHGKGYGQALIQKITHDLAKKNVCVLDVNVNRHNSARNFYERMGFKLLREEDIPVGPYWMNDFVLRLTF